MRPPLAPRPGLARFSALLERYNGLIVIVLSLVFGTWFLVKALTGLGII